MAKRLLTQKGASFEEIDVTGDRAARAELRVQGRRAAPPCRRSGSASMHVGGSDELAALDRDGKLDALLAGDGGVIPEFAPEQISR